MGMRRVEIKRVEMKKEEVKRVGVRQGEERGMRALGLAEGYKRDRTRRETSGCWRGVGSIWGGSEEAGVALVGTGGFGDRFGADGAGIGGFRFRFGTGVGMDITAA